MPQKFIIKHSVTADKVPPVDYLANGELALNIADGLLYFKREANTLSFIANNTTVNTSVSLGYDNIITGINNIQSSAFGVFNNVAAPYSLAVGWSNNRSNQIGRTSLTTGTYSIAVGVLNNSAALFSTTLGHRNIVYSGSNDSFAIGANIKIGNSSDAACPNIMELGYHAETDQNEPGGARLAAIRITKNLGISWNIKDTTHSPGLAATSETVVGQELESKLMISGMMFGVTMGQNVPRLVVYYNHAGTIKYIDFGAMSNLT